MRNYNTFEEECDLLRWRSHELLLHSHKERSFSDLPPELLHWILNFLVDDFKDLIVFSTINETCKTVADYSLHWLKIVLTFDLPVRFTSTLQLSSYSDHFIFPDLPDRYLFPRYTKVTLVLPTIHSLSISLRTTNQHQIAHEVRKSFMTCMISYLKKANEYLLYYKRAERIEELWNSHYALQIYKFFFEFSFALANALLFDSKCKVNHLSVLNHLYFISIIFMYFLVSLGYIFLILRVVSWHIFDLKCRYLHRIFDNFEWKNIHFLLRNFFISLGIIFTLLLIYIKCMRSSSISYWWMTMIPMCLNSFLGVSIFGFHHPHLICIIVFLLTTFCFLMLISNIVD